MQAKLHGEIFLSVKSWGGFNTLHQPHPEYATALHHVTKGNVQPASHHGSGCVSCFLDNTALPLLQHTSCLPLANLLLSVIIICRLCQREMRFLTPHRIDAPISQTQRNVMQAATQMCAKGRLDR